MGRRRLTSQDFWDRVVKTETCWLYQRPLDRDGYGWFHHTAAHRWAWESLVGAIPDGMELDHVYNKGCRHRNCVRPDHLEPVDHRTNSQRAAALKATCPRGHPYDRVFNTKRGPKRGCSICAKDALTRWKDLRSLQNEESRDG